MFDKPPEIRQFFAMTFEIHLAKPKFKFSSAHFTWFSETEYELLHGHNYQVEVKLLFAALDDKDLAVPFAQVKGQLQKVCDDLDEKVLLPRDCPFCEYREEKDGHWLHFAGKRYFFPQEDVLMLPLKNISSEGLASFLSGQLKSHWKTLPRLQQLKVKVVETHGQSVEVCEKFV